MTTVLALYPGTFAFRRQQIALHRPRLDALGIEVVIADDRITDEDRALFDGVVEVPSPEEVGATCRALEGFLRGRRVDALLAQSEGALLAGSIVASRHGLVGLAPAAAHLCANKLACRRALARAGVPQPAFAPAADAAGVRAFADAGNGYPLVLKGVASTLGRLVTLVADEAAVAPAVERLRAGLSESLDIVRLRSFGAAAAVELGCDPAREFLVEAYAPGEPVETDGILVGAEARSFGVTAQVLSRPPHFYVEGYLLPADLAERERAAVERVSAAALLALGVRDSGYSIEMRLERGAARVIEVNGRLGWDEGFGDLFETITGAQPTLQALELVLGAARPFGLRTDVRAAIAYLACYRDAVVARVPSDAEIAALERPGLRVGLATEVGVRTYAAAHPDISPHLAYALAEHPTSSRAAYATARAAVERLRFELAAL